MMWPTPYAAWMRKVIALIGSGAFTLAVPDLKGRGAMRETG